MAEDRLNELAWGMSRFLGAFNRTLINSAMIAQERNIRFAQAVFENSLEVLKSHTDATLTLAEEIAEKPDKQPEVLQEVVNTTVAAYDRNLRLAQSIFNDGIEVLKNSAQDTRELTQDILEQTHKPQEQFQEFAQEATKAYLNFLYMPFTYYRQTLNKKSPDIRKEGFHNVRGNRKPDIL